MITPFIWLTQEVSYETKSGKKTATLVYEFKEYNPLYYIPCPIYLSLQGYFIYLSLVYQPLSFGRNFPVIYGREIIMFQGIETSLSQSLGQISGQI